MGGRGSFTAGGNRRTQFVTKGYLGGYPVLEPDGKSQQHGLPFESSTHRIYIQEHPDGSFKQFRIYSKDHRLRFEVAYHYEPRLSKENKPVLHYHIYTYRKDGTPVHGDAVAIRKDMKIYQKYKHLLKGVKL